MKTKLFLIFIITIGIFASCKNSRNKNNPNRQSIDYSNKAILDSLIKATPHSNDTLFLGFTIGMTKSQYKSHIHKLREEGKIISYSKSNRFSIPLLNKTYNLGAGYTFKTSISTEKSGKTITGEGKYFLEPIYNKAGGLMQLNILSVEEWNADFLHREPNWLKENVIENSDPLKDKDLKQALIDNEFVDEYDFVRRKGNLIIYEQMTVTYIDLKTLLLELLIKETKKEIIKEDNNNIRF